MTAAARIADYNNGHLATKPRHDLKVRHMDFSFDPSIPTWWYDNDPFKTLLLSALSGGFPEGERFFIESVRHYRDRITDPVLQEAIRAFIGQEGHHSREHKSLNDFFVARGLPVDVIDRNVGAFMRWMRKNLSPERQLAHTVAVEHFTAILSEGYMLDETELAKMDERMAKIWAWHAVEETEHKAVAFDVYKTTVNNEWIRVSEMALVTLLFGGFTALDQFRLLRSVGKAGDLKMWLRGLNEMWGVPGRFRKMIPAYLDFYRRDFHPSQHDASDQLARVKARYLGDKA